ncbi:MAG: VOC family protein [Pseudomonadota bacterium]
MALILDHLAVACRDLAEGTAWVEAQLGVTMQPGGQHVRYGTHNTLLGLGDIYLEVIAPDPDAAPFDGPRWFDLDRFTGSPRLANWICQTDHFDPIAGPPVPLKRDNLAWQLTVPKNGSLPFDGAYPTLIKWDADVTHPAQSLSDAGCRLVTLTITHPEADRIRSMIDLADPRVRFETGAPIFRATFHTPNGPRTLQ